MSFYLFYVLAGADAVCCPFLNLLMCQVGVEVSALWDDDDDENENENDALKEELQCLPF